MHNLERYAKRDHIEINTRFVPFLLGGSVALVGLIFALGVLIGSRQPLRETTCTPPDPLSELDAKSKEPTPPPDKPVAALTFYDRLQQPGSGVPRLASLPPGAMDDGAVSASGLAAAGAALAGKPGGEVRQSEPAIVDELEQDEPGTYSLQVGSFQDKAEAVEMARRLEKAGHNAFLVQVNVPEKGERWFRVRVGPFPTKRDAWTYKIRFEEKERLPAFVVKRRT